MRLLCDANIGSIIARALQIAEHDVERAIAAEPDENVLAVAVSQNRVLITCDRDFGDLIFFRGHPAPPAVIYIRFEPENVADIVPRLLPLLDLEQLRDHMTVIDDAHIRRRPFPVRSNDHV